MRTLKTKIACLALGMLLAATGYAADSGYRILRRIQLGGDGNWDSLAVDNNTRSLYIAHGMQVTVMDLESERLVGEIPDTPGAHGIALVSDANRGYVSDRKADCVTVFDLRTRSVLERIKTGDGPDAILYDPASKQVFVFHGGSHDVAILNPSGKVTARIVLDGHPEDAAADGQGRIFVDLKDRNEVAEIDSRKLAVARRFPVAPGDKPLSLSVDPVRQRLFVGCRNQQLVILDAASGRVLANLPIGAGVDGSVYDPESGLVFCASGWDGNLTVVGETAPGNYQVLETVATQRGARTVTIDPKTRNLYLPTAALGPMPEAPALGERKPHPPVIKDTFEVLVVGK